MRLTPHIFRQYDIRGVVGVDLDPEVARAVGRAYGTLLRRSAGDRATVAVGFDNRPSSPALADGVVAGLCESGVQVTSVGMVPTPVLYWAEHSLGANGGIQITGSHNPPEYNGLKMSIAGKSLHGEAIQALRRLIEDGDLLHGEGNLRSQEAIGPYIADVAGRFALPRRVRVAVDCGNGVGSLVAGKLLQAVGAEPTTLYCESDGTFPNHHPDPTVDENLADLIALVRRDGHEVGIGFDGDADRVGVVDERGQIVRGDVVLLLFALDLLEHGRRGLKVVFDVKCSQALSEVIARAGGEPIMWKTGHSLIKEKMRETGAVLAGELSGHICFSDRYLGFDDGLYAACRVVELLARKERALSQMVAELPSYASTPEIRIEVSEREKFDIIGRAVNHFRREYQVVDVDGARVLFGDGWGLLRASNTQPALVARYEARSPERLAEIRGIVEGWLRGQGIDV
ncbi:MAG: phosphomannomutase/phosphoglucomutase [Gemmatimonadetes bacterium]|nr:phosphomannomutase/phosphoglucomutase [Gemmatimonadota bacterium]